MVTTRRRDFQTETSELPLEFGVVEVDHNWKTVSLNRLFDRPVVVTSSTSFADSDPAVVRVKNVDRNSFEVRIQEWDYLDGNHSSEKVNYLVIESGSYVLPGGTRVEAGQFFANAVSSFDTVPFEHSFGTVPVVMTTITTANEGDTVTMRLRNIITTKFDYEIQEQEANSQQHFSEEAGYVAWEPSAGSLGDLLFEIGRTSDSVTQTFQGLNFYEPFSSPPVFLAGMQTTDGPDTASVRCQNKQADGIEIKVEEEKSRDTETNHTTEVIGYMILESQNQVQDDGNPVESLVKEAEAADLYADFEIGSDPAASGGRYVHVPNGTRSSTSRPNERYRIEYTFTVPVSGMYRIKGSVYAASGNDDSFWVKVNDSPGSGYLWDVLQNTGYRRTM